MRNIVHAMVLGAGKKKKTKQGTGLTETGLARQYEFCAQGLATQFEFFAEGLAPKFELFSGLHPQPIPPHLRHP